MEFFMMFEINWKIEFGERVIDIGLENVVAAAASVVELPPHCSNKGGQKHRRYETYARIIFRTAAEARAAGRPSPAFNAPEPHRCVHKTIKQNKNI